MVFEVRLPDKFIGVEVASVYLHLSFEKFTPMVMQEKIELPSEDDEEEEKSVKFPDISKGSSSTLSGVNKIISGGSQLKESQPSLANIKENTPRKPRA